MKSFVQIVLLTAVSAQSISQSIPDIQFEWIRNNDCLPKGICMNIYLKAESNPSLTKLSAKGFGEYLYDTIQELKFDKSENGHIKLKLIFLINEPVCLMKLGYKGIKIGGDQFLVLINKIRSIKSFDPGTQKGIDQNCQAILYLEIKGGKLKKFRNVNFDLLGPKNL